MAISLKTGDVKKYRLNPSNPVNKDDRWAIILNKPDEDGDHFVTTKTRGEARWWRADGNRIAKVLKITPKTVTVEISK